ncbi:MAG: hypothetical protein HYV63_32095 [Candidatus Schekmanbacteria bacterium]|nr:hypothetical protein [Candidatus Schekmanbacteria bacterium]
MRRMLTGKSPNRALPAEVNRILREAPARLTQLERLLAEADALALPRVHRLLDELAPMIQWATGAAGGQQVADRVRRGSGSMLLPQPMPGSRNASCS